MGGKPCLSVHYCPFSPRSLPVGLWLLSLQPAGVHVSTPGCQETCENAVNQCRLTSFTKETVKEFSPQVSFCRNSVIMESLFSMRRKREQIDPSVSPRFASNFGTVFQRGLSWYDLSKGYWWGKALNLDLDSQCLSSKKHWSIEVGCVHVYKFISLCFLCTFHLFLLSLPFYCS